DHGPDGSQGTAAANSPDGSSIYLTGAYDFPATNYATMKLDAFSGAVVWISFYDGHGGKPNDWHFTSFDTAYSVATSQDGASVYVTGASAAPSGLIEYATLAYDAATGTQRWLVREHGTDATGTP